MIEGRRGIHALLLALACLAAWPGALPAGDAPSGPAVSAWTLQRPPAPRHEPVLPGWSRRALAALGEPVCVLLLAGGVVAMIVARERVPPRRR